MRDIALSLIIFGAVPFILMRPWVGIMMWTWLAYFNPQKMTYGFALGMPFSAAIGGVTLLAWLFNPKEPKKPPMCGAVVIWFMFILWMVLTTSFAVEVQAADDQLSKVIKIQIFAMLTLMLANSWERVRQLVWCIVLSIGYYAVKGGIWVVLKGGNTKIWGPAGTFIEGNNELALATLMTIPLAYFLYKTETRQWARRAIQIGIGISCLSVAGSFSRGALLAGAAMAMFLVWRSRQRIIGTIAIGILGLGIFAFMPDSYSDRMQTIQTYEEDGSAMKRLNTWKFAWNFTLDHPILGGGYEVFLSEDAYVRYAPRYDEGWIFQDAHSNYLKVLAEHGFPGLALFLLLFLATWLRAGAAQRWAAQHAPGTQMHSLGVLALMLQASIIAYMVGGAFLGLCYFDLPYNIAGLCIALATAKVQASVQQPASVPASLTTAQPGINRSSPA